VKNQNNLPFAICHLPFNTLLVRKLWRDMLKSGVTYAICIFIVAIGFCGYAVLSLCLINLQGARDDFFAKTAFPEVFAEVQQAPLTVAQRLAALPGVLRAEGRLVYTARLAGSGESPPELKLFSITEGGLARPLLSRGQFPGSGARQIVLGDGFYAAHELAADDEITLMFNGRAETLEVCGSGISPENIYMVKNLADLLPDYYAYDAGFISYQGMGRMWGKENMANEFVLTLNPDANFEMVKDSIKEVLEPYGCYRVYGRDEQFSVALLQMELDQVERMATAIPFIFLVVAAVILYITLYRLIEQQRTQAGTLMAMGFFRREILLHYLGFGIITGFLGGLLGSAGGVLLARPLADYFRVFFSLPPYNAPISWGYLASGTLIATCFCGLVGWGTAYRLAALMPSEALRPASPKAARSSLLEHIPGFINMFTVPGKMAIRSIARNRRRALLAIFGIACAYTITAFFMSMNSLFNVFIFDYLDKTQRHDITVYFSQPVAAADAQRAIKHPAIEYAEGMLEFPATLRGVHGQVDCSVQALVEGSQLFLLFDEQGRQVSPENEGIVLSVLMAGILGVGIGDMVELEVVYPEKRLSRLPVTGIVAQYMGSTAYMSQAGAAKVSDYRGAYTSMLLKAPEEARQALVGALDKADNVALVENRLQRSAGLREYMGLMTLVIAYMACMGIMIGFAVIYTSSLISFEDLKREISTMMMLGLSTKQCLQVVSVEQWLLTIIAFIPGIAMTVASSNILAQAIASDMFALPNWVEPQALFMACALTAVAVLLSSRVMLRRIRRISPVELLRERE